MIEFFRDVLSGPLYVVVAILSIIFIMAIIGFLMERKKLEKEEKEKIAVVETSNIVPSIQPVTIQDEGDVVVSPVTQNQVSNVQADVATAQSVPTSNVVREEEKSTQVVKTPVIVFEDPDQKNE